MLLTKPPKRQRGWAVRQLNKPQNLFAALLIMLSNHLPVDIIAQSIGIGSTNSRSAFNIGHISSNATPHTLLLDQGTGNLINFSQAGQANTIGLWTVGTLQNLQFRTGNTTFLSINAGNTLGINTAAPFSTLHINSPLTTSLLLNGGSSAYFSWAENNVQRGFIGSFYGDVADFDLGTTSNNTTGDILFATNATSRLTVKSNGNLGIGLDNPSDRLVINNGIAIDRGANYYTSGGSDYGKEYALNFGSHAGIGAYRTSLINPQGYSFDLFTNGGRRWRLFTNYLTNTAIASIFGVEVAGTTRADAVIIDNTTTLPTFVSGLHTVGNHNADVETFTVSFGTTFPSPPVVALTVVQEVVNGVTDKFAVSLINVTTTGFTAKLGRVDPERPGNGWGQNMKVSWLAIPNMP